MRCATGSIDDADRGRRGRCTDSCGHRTTYRGAKGEWSVPCRSRARATIALDVVIVAGRGDQSGERGRVIGYTHNSAGSLTETLWTVFDVPVRPTTIPIQIGLKALQLERTELERLRAGGNIIHFKVVEEDVGAKSRACDKLKPDILIGVDCGIQIDDLSSKITWGGRSGVGGIETRANQMTDGVPYRASHHLCPHNDLIVWVSGVVLMRP